MNTLHNYHAVWCFLLLQIKGSHQRSGKAGETRVFSKNDLAEPSSLEHWHVWAGKDLRELGVPDRLKDVTSCASSSQLTVVTGRVAWTELGRREPHDGLWMSTVGTGVGGRQAGACVTPPWPNPFMFHMQESRGREADWLASGHTMSGQPGSAGTPTLSQGSTPVSVWPTGFEYFYIIR